jgi:biotin carboxyl carrier protein
VEGARMEIKQCFLGNQAYGYTCRFESLHDLTITIYKAGLQIGSFSVTILRASQDLSSMSVLINNKVHTFLLQGGKAYAYDVQRPPLEEIIRCIVVTDVKTSRSFSEKMIAPATKVDLNDLTSPLSGRVVQILVKPGDFVSRDAPLLVIESMKMENVLYAVRDAFVKNLFIGVGDLVKQHQRLITFKESGEVYGSVKAAEQQEEVSDQ